MTISWTRRSMCLNVDGFMRHQRYPEGYQGVFRHDDGRTMEAPEALSFLAMEKAKGRKVIPCSSECGKPCKQKARGCLGFDFDGGGCPGYVITEAEALG